MSLFGGILGLFAARRAEKREDARIAQQNAYNDPGAIRKRYEAAGINPILGFAGGAIPAASGPATDYMGSAVANLATFVADKMMTTAPKRAQYQQAQQRNKELEQKLIKLTNQPIVPGIFDKRASEKAASGVSIPGLRGPAGAGKEFGDMPKDVATPSLNGMPIPGPENAGTMGNIGPFSDPLEIVPAGQTELATDYVAPNGTVMRIYEGPDADELVTGYALHKYSEWADPQLKAAKRGESFGFNDVVIQQRHEMGQEEYLAARERKSELWSQYWAAKNPHFLLKNGGADFRAWLKTAPLAP